MIASGHAQTRGRLNVDGTGAVGVVCEREVMVWLLQVRGVHARRSRAGMSTRVPLTKQEIKR